MMVASIINKRKRYLRPEHFGGLAYMKPLDGRKEFDINFPLINYTPLGNNTTRITSTLPNTFTERDLGKRFCGLFNHMNPNTQDFTRIDEYEPGNIGARYSTVIEVEDDQNIIVDFEYNGGNEDTPQNQLNGKGYIFFDNYIPFKNMWLEYENPSNKDNLILLEELKYKNNFEISCYVTPQFHKVSVKEKGLKITSENGKPSRWKYGIEDYYHYERAYYPYIYEQHTYLFNLGTLSPLGQLKFKDILSYNLQLTPPHRVLISSNNYQILYLEGSGWSGNQMFIKLNNSKEYKSIENGVGITFEKYRAGTSTLHHGGSYTGPNDVITSDIGVFNYQYFSDFDFRGINAGGNFGNQSGGSFYVLENGFMDYNPETFYSPGIETCNMRVVQDKTGLNPIFSSSYYSPNVLEIDGVGNFWKTSINFGNRNSYAVIKRDDTETPPFVFLIQSKDMNIFSLYYNRFYHMDNPTWSGPNLSSKKNQMLYDIPLVGNRYIIGVDYSINKGLSQLEGGQIPTPTPILNSIRTAICWSTVLQKGAIDIDKTTEIPVNSRPLELQIGDQFKIVGDLTEEVYTVIQKQQGVFPSWGYELILRTPEQTGSKQSIGYNYLRCILDKNLPEEVGLTFEIEIITSTSQILLDGNTREAYHIYRGGGGFINNTSTNFYTNNRVADGQGHLAYINSRVTKYFKNVDFNNSFWRENYNQIALPTWNINGNTVLSLIRYPKGVWLIDCKRAMKGGTNDSWIGSPVSRQGFFYQKLIYEDNPEYIPEYVERDQIQHPPKYRVYNTPSATFANGVVLDPEYSVEVHENSDDAPPPPKPITDMKYRINKAFNLK